ncbi:MAG TPA: DUF1302 family protein [Candidatus Acidoferrales bacterium]|nr:DUF1302 family protein [Candidatus Acidoferrales bacterium]
MLLALSGLPQSVAALQSSVAGRDADLDLLLGVREVVEQHDSSTHERTQETLRVRAGVGLTDWLKFDSTTLASNGGPTMKATRSGVYNWNDAFQENSFGLDFEEAYFDAHLGSFDTRIGKQRIAWGKMDRFSPNDVLNTFSYLDPLLQEENERRIGTPAIQTSYFPSFDWLPSESRATAVWIPAYLPYRFGNAKCDNVAGRQQCDIERWFPPAAVPPRVLSIPGSIIGLPGGNSALGVPISFAVTNRPPPARRLDNGEIGLRYSGLVHDADVAVYYYNGYDPSPAFLLNAEALGQPDPNPANPIHVRDLSGATTLTPVYKRIQSAGADAAYAVDLFTFRAEAAYFQDRPFARDLRTLVSDPSEIAPQLRQALIELANGQGRATVPLPASYVTRNAVEWAVAADCTFHGYWALLQFNQTDVLHNDANLLIANAETRVVLNIRKSFLDERLRFQLVGIHAIERDYSVLRPRVSYRISDQLDLEGGYLLIAGRSQSVLGEYSNNDEAWFGLNVRL